MPCESAARNENAWLLLCCGSSAGGDTDAEDTLDPSSLALLLELLLLDSVALHKLSCECVEASSWLLGVSCMADPLLLCRACECTPDSGDITALCGDECRCCGVACCICCCIFACALVGVAPVSIQRGGWTGCSGLSMQGQHVGETGGLGKREASLQHAAPPQSCQPSACPFSLLCRTYSANAACSS